MPTDDAAVYELVQAIGSLGDHLPYEGSSLIDGKRAELVQNAEKLAIAAREPAENLYFQGTQTAQNSVIRTAINMGIFEKIPSSGDGVSVTDLAEATVPKVNALLLARILRALTSVHILHCPSPSHYIHNAFSSIFLIPSNRDMFRQMYDFLGRGVYTMPQFLASTSYQNPTEYLDSPFQYGHKTSLGFFEYLAEDPDRSRVFNSGMQSLATIGDARRSAGCFPFDQELDAHMSAADVAIVDVGGGRGQVLIAIKELFPDLKGRMVLQDMREVIYDAVASGLPDWIEPMAASFFERQMVEDAHIYHFRRIFHDWSDAVSLRILQHTVPAMTSRSRILITDTVVPEMDAPRHVALQDINMMSFGGMERTEKQWEGLLREAGLRVVRIWERKGDLQRSIEAVLA